tara:strand:- start:99 stop:488 length:390 start_codon:yes stop_codon:yes gene_type:complete
LVVLDNLRDILLISIGAVFGANTRFFIYKKLVKANLNKNYIILIINIFASFFLGVFISTLSRISSLSYSNQLGLFFSIGLLGSLSTFSTFIYDLFELLIQLKFYRAFKLFIISLTSGLVSFVFGYLIGG